MEVRWELGLGHQLGDITVVCPVLNGHTDLETEPVTNRSQGVNTSENWSGIPLIWPASGHRHEKPGRQAEPLPGCSLGFLLVVEDVSAQLPAIVPMPVA